MPKFLLAMLVSLFVLPRLAPAAPDIVIADFEQSDYGNWTTTGTAFGTGPAQGALPNQQKVDGFLGHGLVNSYLNGDASQGTLTSPDFTIDRPYISFLIGGGDHPDKTCMNLVVEGKVIHTATGANDEHLDWCTWDVKQLLGKKASLQIVDRVSDQWGHINVDQIIQTDNPPVMLMKQQALYQESLRPQFHFTCATNWLNDPNGLVFYQGEYHLFCQHNPDGINWGNMTWAHAVSPDLVHWTQLPDAIKPDDFGTIFSGSAVVDWKNTSGFGVDGQPPLVAMYTAAGGTNEASKGKQFSQCIAYSNDKGRTWTKYQQNPVLPHIVGENRDPKLVWYQPKHKWILALYKDGEQYALFDSADLKQWNHLQDLNLPGCSECPDFFPIALDGDASKPKWVFTSASGRYLVGNFDGNQFIPDQELRQVDFGTNYYAVQSYSDVPDGRRIQIAWMRDGKYPGMPFNGQMSFPCEMQLKTTGDGLRLFRFPVKEIESLQGQPVSWRDLTLTPGIPNPLADIKGDLFHIKAIIDPGTATDVGFNIRGQTIHYSDHRLFAIGDTAYEPNDHQPNDHQIAMEILVDRTSIETFIDGGRYSFTSCYLPTNDRAPLELFATGGSAKVNSLSVYPLKSAWK
jgi:sucrose-6-phosphate hydrolase SacC (GH32 family)